MAAVGRLKNAVTLITGGFGNSGYAAAGSFLKAGSKVVILDVPLDDGHYSTKDLSPNCIAVPADVTKEDDVRKVLDITMNRFGRLDNLINCALPFRRTKKLYNFTVDAPIEYSLFDQAMKVAVGGALNVTRLAVEQMAKNTPSEDGQRGVIINRSTISAFDGQEGCTVDAASKGAIVSMTLPLSRDLSSLGIRVNCIAQGWMSDENKRKNIKLTKLQIMESLVLFPSRFVEYKEFADLCVSVVENPMLNGEVIRLDGGLRLPV